MKRWHGSCIGALLVLLIGGSALLFIVPVGGAMLVGVPPVFDALTGWVVCPGAVAIEQDEFNHGPVTTSPSDATATSSARLSASWLGLWWTGAKLSASR